MIKINALKLVESDQVPDVNSAKLIQNMYNQIYWRNEQLFQSMTFAHICQHWGQNGNSKLYYPRTMQKIIQYFLECYKGTGEPYTRLKHQQKNEMSEFICRALELLYHTINYIRAPAFCGSGCTESCGEYLQTCSERYAGKVKKFILRLFEILKGWVIKCFIKMF